MYEERKNSFTLRDIILQLLLVVLFIFVLIWLFPTKGYLNQNYASKEDVNELSVQLNAIYGRLFADNIESMRDASLKYFTTSRLPKNVGDSVTLTLKEMQEKKLVLDFKDSNNSSCDTSKSYVQLTKMDDEYQMKVQLTCSDYSDYIIVYVGCYNYCENAVCENKTQTTQTTTKTTNTTKTTTKPQQTNNNTQPTTPTTPEKKYQYEYRLTTQNTYSEWSDWSDWSTKKVVADNLTQVKMKTRQVLQGYEKEYGIVEYRKETYVEYETSKEASGTKVVDSQPAEEVVTKYDYKNATKSTTKGSYSDWKYVGYVNSTSALSNSDTVKYEFYSSNTTPNCTNTCKKVTTYTYKKYVRSYTAGATTYTCPTGYSKSAWFDSNHLCYKVVSSSKSCSKYGDSYKLSGNNCVKTTTTYETVKTPVTKTRKVPVYGYIKGDPIYETVTYYRYRTRKQLTTAGTKTVWSDSQNDTTLLNQGYVLTGNKKEV